MIETQGLCRDFGDRRVVDSLDLAIEPGEIYGFLGPNGAGKTTTIRMLCGLLRPTSGSIRIDGRDLKSDLDHARRVSGLVPDTPPLYEYLSARQYIGFVASLYGVEAGERDSRCERLLEAFGLADRADELCMGLSHGMRKKVHLAAVLTTRPRVLLMDEPTTGLDPESARVLKDLLVEHKSEGATIFLSTHLLETAERICDRVGILAEGKLRAEGPPAELLSERGEGSLEEIFLRLAREARETVVEPN